MTYYQHFITRSSSLCLLLMFHFIASGQLVSEERQHIENPSVSFYKEVYSQPSAQPWSPTLGQGKAELLFNSADRSNYHLLQQGESLQNFGFYSESTIQQNNYTLWGSASYTNSTRENVKWSGSSDPFRVGPYAISDSTTGTFYGESYELIGGIALPLGKGTLGTEVFYTIKQEYQKKDPRPQNNVFDMSAKVSYSRPITKNYNIGAGVSAGKYSQKSAIKSFESLRYDTYYAMKGFGLYDMQLSGQHSAFYQSYLGQNVGVQLFLHPIQTEGKWHALLTYNYEGIESNHDDIYPFLYKTQDLTMDVGYQIQTASPKIALKAKVTSHAGKGTERIYNYTPVDADSVFWDYTLLSEAQRFERNVFNYSIEALALWDQNKNSYWIQGKVNYFSFDQKYISPYQSLQTSWLSPTLELGVDKAFRKSRLMASITSNYRPSVTVSSVLTSVENRVDNWMETDIATVEQGACFNTLAFKYSSVWENKKICPYVEGKVASLSSNKETTYQFSLTVGIDL